MRDEMMPHEWGCGFEGVHSSVMRGAAHQWMWFRDKILNLWETLAQNSPVRALAYGSVVSLWLSAQRHSSVEKQLPRMHMDLGFIFNANEK